MIFYIIGFMGAGKSSLGRGAAKKLGLQFVDMDMEVEKMHGASVADIFAREGEEVFRKSEREMLARWAIAEQDVIIAAGGGAPCHEDNMSVMNERGKTVYLKLSPRKLVGRLNPVQSKRPKLKGMNREQILEYIEQTLPLREPFYLQASMVIDCDTLSDESICSYVVDYVKYHTGNK